jgi:hypothetical protein
MTSPNFPTEKELSDQRNALYCAVGEALTAWAEVESALGALFAYAVNREDHMAGFRAYWNIVSFEAKLAVCHATIKAAVSYNPDLTREWSAIHNRLLDKNKKRNKLAHGQVVQQARDFAKRDFFQEVWFIPYYVSGQLGKGISSADQERLSVKEIKEIRKGFTIAQNRLIGLLTKCLQARTPQ